MEKPSATFSFSQSKEIFWAWGGEGRADALKGSAGSFLGDPPCEPQGLNSVFDTDASTLAIIAAANKKLAALAG